MITGNIYCDVMEAFPQYIRQTGIYMRRESWKFSARWDMISLWTFYVMHSVICFSEVGWEGRSNFFTSEITRCKAPCLFLVGLCEECWTGGQLRWSQTLDHCSCWYSNCRDAEVCVGLNHLLTRHLSCRGNTLIWNCYKLMWLIAQEDFITFGCHENFRF